MSTNFIDKWRLIGERHLIADRSVQNKLDLGSAAFDFLFITGMPSEFQELNFDYIQRGVIQTVNEGWKLNDSKFDRYLVIGSNGSGDPVVLNQINQELIYLNHDNEFQEVFINSDLKKFAQSVLRIQNFMDQITQLTPDSLFETEFSDESYEKLLTDLNQIDPKVFQIDEGHWFLLLNTLKWEREQERSNDK